MPENRSVGGFEMARPMGPQETTRQSFRQGRGVDCFEIRAPEPGVLGFEVVTRAESTARPVVGLLEPVRSSRAAGGAIHHSQSFLALAAAGDEVFTLCVAFLRPPAPGEEYLVVSAFVGDGSPREAPQEEEENPEEDEPIPDPRCRPHLLRLDPQAAVR